MTGKQRGPTMAERLSLSTRPASKCQARHCWVSDAADRRGEKRPGLLVEWRTTESGGWEGLVIYAAELRAGEWAVVQEWLGEALLSPS